VITVDGQQMQARAVHTQWPVCTRGYLESIEETSVTRDELLAGAHKYTSAMVVKAKRCRKKLPKMMVGRARR